jgi:predicted RNA methylase
LGSGNGSLCGAINAQGYDVCGLEYDKEGVNISKDSYANNNYFDLVVSTEVIEYLY